MKLKVINANTTASMTALIGSCARGAVAPGTRVDAVSPASGPAAIESHSDEVWAAAGVIDEILAGEAAGYDGYVIACFSDPGLAGAREAARGPVVGIAEAAMRTAGYVGRRFAVITTLDDAIEPAWELARRYGAADRCGDVRATGISVLGLASDPTTYSRILAESMAALEGDGVDTIVLGCAGMADLSAKLSTDLGVPVVDGVTAATTQVESLVRLGLHTSKIGEFAFPPLRP